MFNKPINQSARPQQNLISANSHRPASPPCNQIRSGQRWSLLTVAQQQETVGLLVSASRALINNLKNRVDSGEASDE